MSFPLVTGPEIMSSIMDSSMSRMEHSRIADEADRSSARERPASGSSLAASFERAVHWPQEGG